LAAWSSAGFGGFSARQGFTMQLQVAELCSAIVLLRIGVYQLLSLRPQHESPTALPLRMASRRTYPVAPSANGLQEVLFFWAHSS